MGEETMKMERFESYASDESLHYIALVREEPEQETDQMAALELVAATAALCGDWIAPLTANVRVESCDPANFYIEDSDHPPAFEAWFLRRRVLDERLHISPIWNNSQERHAEVIGEAEMLEVVREAIEQPPPADHLEVTLAELLIQATAVALPQGVELALRYSRGPIDPLLVNDGQKTFALGPEYGPIGPPARLRASNEHGITNLSLSLLWDLWILHPAGRAQVRAAVERVLSRGRGWRLEQGELPL
jgi:hypothetical protein